MTTRNNNQASNKPNMNRIARIIRHAGKFRNLDAARRWAASSNLPTWIVMGDHDGETGVYWTVRPVDAARLERVGYEMVR